MILLFKPFLFGSLMKRDMSLHLVIELSWNDKQHPIPHRCFCEVWVISDLSPLLSNLALQQGSCEYGATLLKPVREVIPLVIKQVRIAFFKHRMILKEILEEFPFFIREDRGHAVSLPPRMYLQQQIRCMEFHAKEVLSRI